MLQSHLFGKTLRQAPKDAESRNHELLVRANFIDQLQAGVFSYLPLGLLVLHKISNIVREEMNKIGGQELLLPALHPKEPWQQTGRWQSFDALYRLKSRQGKEMALGPTHEEVLVPLVKKFVSSWKDLPIYLYQIQNKYRDEPRAKSGLLRGREFLMKDLYSLHSSREDLKKYYEEVKKSYLKIFKRLELDTVVCEASGGTFTKDFSHEFQVFSDSGEDVVFYCPCGFAQNKEVAKAKIRERCPNCNKKIKESKAIEVGNIFDLGDKFSKDFELLYQDKHGNKKPVLIGCYGIGISRVMGTIVEVHNDKDGIIWPKSLAPFDIHLIELDKKADLVYKELSKKYQVLFDDRKIQAGEKFKDADLIGIPIRVVVSKKAGTKVEIKRRESKQTKLVKLYAI